MTTPLRDLASVIRTKNSGPFLLTIDVIFDQQESYRLTKRSGVINRESIALLYGLKPDEVLRVIFHDRALGIKIVTRRRVSAGSPGDSDVYGCQQHAPMLTLGVPTAV